MYRSMFSIFSYLINLHILIIISKFKNLFFIINVTFVKNSLKLSYFVNYSKLTKLLFQKKFIFLPCNKRQHI